MPHLLCWCDPVIQIHQKNQTLLWLSHWESVTYEHHKTTVTITGTVFRVFCQVIANRLNSLTGIYFSIADSHNKFFLLLWIFTLVLFSMLLLCVLIIVHLLCNCFLGINKSTVEGYHIKRQYIYTVYFFLFFCQLNCSSSFKVGTTLRQVSLIGLTAALWKHLT